MKHFRFNHSQRASLSSLCVCFFLMSVFLQEIALLWHQKMHDLSGWLWPRDLPSWDFSTVKSPTLSMSSDSPGLFFSYATQPTHKPRQDNAKTTFSGLLKTCLCPDLFLWTNISIQVLWQWRSEDNRRSNLVMRFDVAWCVLCLVKRMILGVTVDVVTENKRCFVEVA